MTPWRLVSNPFALIDVAPATDGVKRAWTYAPLRGRSAIEREFRVDDEPEMVAFLERVKTAKGPQRFSAAELDRLAEIGFLVGRDEVPEFVPLVCEVTPERVESLAREPIPDDVASWVTHPAMERWDPETVPPWFTADARWWRPSPEAAVLSWRHPATGLVNFCQLRGELAEALPTLAPGETPVVSPRVRDALVHLGLVVPPDFVAREKRAWDADIARAREDLATRGWHPLPRIFTDAQRTLLYEHVLGLQKAGFLSTRSGFSPLRYSMNGGAWISTLHGQIQPLLERACGRPLARTSGYAMVYEQGSDLPRHIDRLECDLVVSALLAYEPASESPAQWPLFLAQKPDGTPAATNTVPGAGIIYEGRAVPHWRERLPAGHRVSVAIFCFRRLDGDVTG